jgi:hypothetical protein
VCDGKDNDCNGSTDEANAIGAPKQCANQKGVCAGAKEVCKGAAGWVCDAAVFQAHSSAYQAAEAKCDGKDNDCDGQTDEGLLNACGKCGAAPTEVCNGVDDDCDGATDEVTACAACQPGSAGVEIQRTYSDYDGFQMSWKNFLAMLGDSPYVFYEFSGYYGGDNHLVRLVDGQSVEDHTVSGIATVGNPSIWPAQTFFRVAVTAYHDFGGYSYQQQGYYELDPQGYVTKSSWIGDSTNISGAPSPIAQGGSTVGMVYWPSVSGTTYPTPLYITLASDGTWEMVDYVSGSGDYGLQLGLRSNGSAFVATKSSSFEGPVYLEQVGGQSYTVDGGECGSPALRVAPDDTVWVVYPGDVSTSTYQGTIRAWAMKGSAAPAASEDVGYGAAPNLAFDNAGRPVVVFAQGTTEIAVATRTGAGKWTLETAWAGGAYETVGGYTAIGVDSAGRYHLVFTSNTPAEGGAWNSTTHLKYVMFCTSVPGGSGGSGGPVTPAGCGLDPAHTCSGFCGSGGATPGGCWCNSYCSDYGDCCPDYQECCG